MKNSFRTILTVLAVGLLGTLLCLQASATTISGAITFSGGATLDTGNANTATAVTAWSNTKVTSSTLTGPPGVNVNDAVAFTAPWSFNTNVAISDFWAVDGYTFTLLNSHIVNQGNGFLSVSGSGTLSGNGFDPTPGDFSFTTQNPSAGGVFSFSAGTQVPEPASMLLLGTGLSGLATMIRRKKLSK